MTKLLNIHSLKQDTSILNLIKSTIGTAPNVSVLKEVTDGTYGFIKELYLAYSFSNIAGTKTLNINFSIDNPSKNLKVYFATGFDTNAAIDRQPGGTWDSDGNIYYWDYTLYNLYTNILDFPVNLGSIFPLYFLISDTFFGMFWNHIYIGEQNANKTDEVWYAPEHTMIPHNIIISSIQSAGSNPTALLMKTNAAYPDNMYQKNLLLYNDEWYETEEYDNNIFEKRTFTDYLFLQNATINEKEFTAAPLLIKGKYYDNSEEKIINIGTTDTLFSTLNCNSLYDFKSMCSLQPCTALSFEFTGATNTTFHLSSTKCFNLQGLAIDAVTVVPY